MADTKFEMKQGIDEDNRKRDLENNTIYDLIDMISESNNQKIDKSFPETFRKDILQFIIDNNIDLE